MKNYDLCHDIQQEEGIGVFQKTKREKLAASFHSLYSTKNQAIADNISRATQVKVVLKQFDIQNYSLKLEKFFDIFGFGVLEKFT